MSWLTAADYAAAEPDPLLPVAQGILRHMNDDHADALLDYCRAFGRVEPTSAELVGVDRYGLDVLATLDGEDKRAVRVPFTERTDTTDAVRRQTVALLRAARAQLAD
jgi:putative heme iron utilization protein